MIRVENLHHQLGDHLLFDGLDLEIRPGEVVGIIGPSGTGKSTLLECMALLTEPKAGKVFLNGTRMTRAMLSAPEIRGKIGMVFQSFNLFEHMTVIENVMAGPARLAGVDQRAAFAAAMEQLRQVGLYDKAYLRPESLSGGQKQRAAIARTLAMKPDVILFDEPTSALDPAAKAEVATVIRMLAREGRTMVIVSHELELIRSICTRVVFLYGGKVWEDGSPAKLLTEPEREETRRFVLALRLLELDVDSEDFDFIGLQTTLGNYASQTGISQALLTKLQSVLEELFQAILLDAGERIRMQITVECNDRANRLSGRVLCSGKPVDMDDPMQFLSWQIIRSRAADITVEPVSEGDLHSRICFELTDK